MVNEIDGENFLMIIIVEDIIKIEILEDFFFLVGEKNYKEFWWLGLKFFYEMKE